MDKIWIFNLTNATRYQRECGSSSAILTKKCCRDLGPEYRKAKVRFPDTMNKSEWKEMSQKIWRGLGASSVQCKTLRNIKEAAGPDVWKCMEPYFVNSTFRKLIATENFTQVFGSIIYFPLSDDVVKIFDDVNKRLEQRTLSVTEILRKMTNTNSAPDCFRTAALGFPNREEALKRVELAKISSNLLTSDCDVEKGPKWLHPFTLAVLDFSSYTESNPTYTLISRKGPGRATTGELTFLTLLDDVLRGPDARANRSPSRSDIILKTLRQARFNKCAGEKTQNKFFFMLLFLMLIAVLSYSSIDIMKQLTMERQSNHRNFLLSLGVSALATTLSWLVYLVIATALICVSAALIIAWKYPLASAALMIMVFLLMNLSQCAFLMLAVACMGTTKGVTGNNLANVCNVIQVIGGFGAWFAIGSPSSFHGSKVTAIKALCLLFPAPYILVGRYMQRWMELGVTSAGVMLAESPYDWDEFGGMATCLIFLVLDPVLYLLIAAIIETVREKSSLIKFILRRTPSDHREEGVGIELPTRAETDGISLFGVSKRFGEFQALSDVTVNFPGGKISAFLGENGAGKTTTANIIAGFTDTSAGTVYYGGKSLQGHRSDLQAQLSYLPQEDILYDYLSLSDHVKFYGWLKGLSTEQINQACAELSMYSLDEVANVLGHKLSGGQKRKLGILIAFLGTPRYIILDEPTSGVDVFSARTIWDVILKRRGSATTIISTHRIEDAEALADNVVIIDSGKIAAEGAPFELKEQTKMGFTLIVDPTGLDSSQMSIVKDVLKNSLKVDDAKIRPDQGTLTVPVDVKAGSSESFVDCIKKLEDTFDEMGQGSYGVADASLGDVYQETLKVHHGTPRMTDLSLFGSTYKQPRHRTFTNHLSVLLMRRLRYAASSKTFLFISFIVPIIFAAFTRVVKPNPAGDVISGPLLTERKYEQKNWMVSGDAKNCPNVSWFSQRISSNRRSWGLSSPTCRCPNDLPCPVHPYKAKHSFDDMYHVDVDSNSELRPLFDGTAWPDVNVSTRFLGASKSSCKNPNKKEAVIEVAILENDGPRALAFFWEALLEGLTAQTIDRRIEHGSIKDGLVFDIEGQMKVMMSMMFFISGVPIILLLVNDFVSTDIASGGKHLLDIAGVVPLSYWLSNFFVDGMQITVILIPLLACTEIWLPATPIKHVSLYPLAMFAYIPYVYLVLRKKGKCCLVGEQASAMLPMIGFGFGSLAYIDPTSIFSQMFRYMTYVLRLNPVFFIGDTVALRMMEPMHITPVRESFIRTQYYIALGTGIAIFAIYATLLVLLESGFKFKQRKKADTCHPNGETSADDEDVKNEAKHTVDRISNTQANGTNVPPLAAVGLTKCYDNKAVVDDVTFAVENCECFGLLGVNGAGKTTTFRMLAGLTEPDLGECYIHGTPYSGTPNLINGKVSYCPQEDTLFEYLTTSQHVDLFATLSGYSPEDRVKLEEMCKEAMNISEYNDRKVSKLSGGNKKKVQLISSIIGCPTVAFLDEPTTGLDPAARQLAWSVIGEIKKNASVILTSHSLDDCEALCDRLVIMVAGQFMCIGTIQHLKHKLGNRYTFRIKVESSEQADVGVFIKAKLDGNASLIDRMPNWLVYEITAAHLGRVSRLYEILLEAKSKFNIESTVVSQMTLQDVFFRMARLAEEKTAGQATTEVESCCPMLGW